MMKKRWISFLLAVCMLTALLPAGAVPAFAGNYVGPGTVETDGNYQYTLDDAGNATIVAYTGTGTSVTIPETVGGHPVTAIGEYAFSPYSNVHNSNDNCYDITTVNIEAKLTSIGEAAFSECENLTTINLPDTITEMGYGVFGGCTALESIAFPRGMTEIPVTTFSACTSLKSITIPETIESIGQSAFDIWSYDEETDEDTWGSLNRITYGGTKEMWTELLKNHTGSENDVLEMLTKDNKVIFLGNQKPEPPKPDPDPEPKPDPKPEPAPEEPVVEESAPDVLGAVGMVATAGVGAAAIGYAGYQVGTELYLIKLLPEGAAIPENAGELALLVWNNAGKPAPAALLPADASETQQAMTWAVEQDLLPADEKPEDAVSRTTVIRTWKKAQKLAD